MFGFSRSKDEIDLGHAYGFINENLGIHYEGPVGYIAEISKAATENFADIFNHEDTGIEVFLVSKDRPNLELSGGENTFELLELIEVLGSKDYKTAESILTENKSLLSDATGGALPLIQHSSWGDLETVSFLLKHGADVNGQDDMSMTSLHWAAAYGYKKLVDFLINQGADADIQSVFYLTPGELAVHNRNHSIGKKLTQLQVLKSDLDFEIEEVSLARLLVELNVI